MSEGFRLGCPQCCCQGTFLTCSISYVTLCLSPAGGLNDVRSGLASGDGQGHMLHGRMSEGFRLGCPQCRYRGTFLICSISYVSPCLSPAGGLNEVRSGLGRGDWQGHTSHCRMSEGFRLGCLQRHCQGTFVACSTSYVSLCLSPAGGLNDV